MTLVRPPSGMAADPISRASYGIYRLSSVAGAYGLHQRRLISGCWEEKEKHSLLVSICGLLPSEATLPLQTPLLSGIQRHEDDGRSNLPLFATDAG